MLSYDEIRERNGWYSIKYLLYWLYNIKTILFLIQSTSLTLHRLNSLGKIEGLSRLKTSHCSSFLAWIDKLPNYNVPHQNHHKHLRPSHNCILPSHIFQSKSKHHPSFYKSYQSVCILGNLQESLLFLSICPVYLKPLPCYCKYSMKALLIQQNSITFTGFYCKYSDNPLVYFPINTSKINIIQLIYYLQHIVKKLQEGVLLLMFSDS